VESGSKGVQAAKAGQIDLVIMDVGLPGAVLEVAKGAHSRDSRAGPAACAQDFAPIDFCSSNFRQASGQTLRTLGACKCLAEHRSADLRPPFTGNESSLDVGKGSRVKKRLLVDFFVERSLYQRAVGYHYDAVKIFMPAGAKKQSCHTSSTVRPIRHQQYFG
jgi:hypothetical protein